MKRVVATGGDTIAYVDARDGTVIDDGYLDPSTVRPGRRGGDLAETTVPAGHAIVLGDNRNESLDSRAFGAVGSDRVEGVVVWSP